MVKLAWKPRFGLRTLFAFVTAACIFSGLVLRPAYQQKRVVSDLRDLGAEVIYDYQLTDITPDRQRKMALITSPLILSKGYVRSFGIKANAEPPWPLWLVNLLGMDCFSDAVAVRMTRSDVRDIRRCLQTACNLRSIEHLEIIGFANLWYEDQRSMEGPELNGLLCGDRDLPSIADMKNLRTLSFVMTSVKSRQLEPLKCLSRLETILIVPDFYHPDFNRKEAARLRNVLAGRCEIIWGDGELYTGSGGPHELRIDSSDE